MRALVIDDSAAVRKILARMLAELGWDVCEAQDGRAAMAQLEATGPVDLALVDWHMEPMNGFEFVCAVREQAQWSATRLVMVTTETDVTRILAALTAGADEYVMKPFTRDMLIDKLALLGLGEAPR
jgi:two-component system chemotaxis response regulator CheY